MQKINLNLQLEFLLILEIYIAIWKTNCYFWNLF